MNHSLRALRLDRVEQFERIEIVPEIFNALLDSVDRSRCADFDTISGARKRFRGSIGDNHIRNIHVPAPSVPRFEHQSPSASIRVALPQTFSLRIPDQGSAHFEHPTDPQDVMTQTLRARLAPTLLIAGLALLATNCVRPPRPTAASRQRRTRAPATSIRSRLMRGRQHCRASAWRQIDASRAG